MPKAVQPEKSIESVNREIDEHFAKEAAAKADPFALQAVKFNVHQRGSLALVKLPFDSRTPDFGIARRSIKQVADQCQVTVLFFDSRQEYESFDGNDDLALARLGLQKIPR
jgi:hypothetical protein